MREPLEAILSGDAGNDALLLAPRRLVPRDDLVGIYMVTTQR